MRDPQYLNQPGLFPCNPSLYLRFLHLSDTVFGIYNRFLQMSMELMFWNW